MFWELHRPHNRYRKLRRIQINLDLWSTWVCNELTLYNRSWENNIWRLTAKHHITTHECHMKMLAIICQWESKNAFVNIFSILYDLVLLLTLIRNLCISVDWKEFVVQVLVYISPARKFQPLGTWAKRSNFLKWMMQHELLCNNYRSIIP